MSRELPDFGVEVIDLLFVVGFHFGDAFAIIHKQLMQILNRFRFPPLEDIRMDAMLACQLGNRLFFL